MERPRRLTDRDWGALTEALRREDHAAIRRRLLGALRQIDDDLAGVCSWPVVYANDEVRLRLDEAEEALHKAIDALEKAALPPPSGHPDWPMGFDGRRIDPALIVQIALPDSMGKTSLALRADGGRVLINLEAGPLTPAQRAVGAYEMVTDWSEECATPSF
jgi:hypothetical protein